MDTFAPIKTLLEQASTQIVESRQMAIAERSQRVAAEEDAQTERQAIQDRIEEMRQQIMARETERQANLFSKICRWFNPTN
jgi:hypothetical protein